MSGIVGIVNLDGAPVDRELLSAMTQALSFPWSESVKSWFDGQVGFGHTLLRTAPATDRDEQPANADGKFWITADARIDGRAELIEKLRSNGSQNSLEDPDHELILSAYRTWGSDCVEHLLGEFSFAIWNTEKRRLFCARDHFGFKPFYYARFPNSFVFSNSLDCLRMHPSVSDKFNEAAIADFLLFGLNRDQSTTVYSGISRIPAASSLECGPADFTVRHYWTLPEIEPIYFKRPQDCVDQFRELLDSAVGDRMRSNTVCVALSGGLDSTTVAASARRVLDKRGGLSDLWSYTNVYKSLIPHEEGYYSERVAEALRISLKHYANDNGKLYGDFDDPNYSTPQPIHVPMGFSGNNPLPDIAERGRVLMTGYGADPALSSLRTAHIRREIKARKFGRLAKDLMGYFSAERRFSRLYLSGHWYKFWHPRAAIEEYPEWLDPEFEKRVNIRDRWHAASADFPPNNSARPEAYSSMVGAPWGDYCEGGNPGISRFPVELRHPFFDLRLIKFLLALPALPWSVDKEILREASRGILPDAVRLRKKTTLLEDPIIATLQRPEAAWVDHFEPAPDLRSYVVQSRIPRLVGTQDSIIAWVNLRPISLNFWLQRLKVSDYTSRSHSAGGNL